MSDIAKWGILIAAITVAIGMLLAFPFYQYIDVVHFSNAISTIIDIAGYGFGFARGLINNFLSSWARSVLSGLMLWLIAKWLITFGLKAMVWVYHYIFK